MLPEHFDKVRVAKVVLLIADQVRFFQSPFPLVAHILDRKIRSTAPNNDE